MSDVKKRKEIESQRVKLWELEKKLTSPSPLLNINGMIKAHEDILNQMKIANIFSPSKVLKFADWGLKLTLMSRVTWDPRTKADYFIKEMYDAMLVAEGEDSSSTKHLWNLLNKPNYRKQFLNNAKNFDNDGSDGFFWKPLPLSRLP